jgi:hypothetical protein
MVDGRKMKTMIIRKESPAEPDPDNPYNPDCMLLSGGGWAVPADQDTGFD